MKFERFNPDEIYIIEDGVRYTLPEIERLFEKLFGGRTDVIGTGADLTSSGDDDDDDVRSKKSKNRRKKEKKRKKQKKHKKRRETSSSDSSDDNDGKKSSDAEEDARLKAEKKATLDKLRVERLERERKERERTEILLYGKSRTNKTVEEKQEERLKETRKYNNQFNPDMARQNKLDSKKKYWLE